MRELLVVDQARGHTGKVTALHMCADIRIDAGNIRLSGVACRRHRERGEWQCKQCEQTGQDSTNDGARENRFHVFFLFCEKCPVITQSLLQFTRGWFLSVLRLGEWPPTTYRWFLVSPQTRLPQQPALVYAFADRY